METNIPDFETSDISDFIEDEFQILFIGDKDAIYQINKLNPIYYMFIDSIFNIDIEIFCCVIDDNIVKFLKGKKKFIFDKFKAKFSKEYHIFFDLFQRKNADILSLYRLYNYKIEIISSKESLLQKNRSFFQSEFMVIKKWLDIEVNKGLICKSTVSCISFFLFVWKLGGGVRICIDY